MRRRIVRVVAIPHTSSTIMDAIYDKNPNVLNRKQISVTEFQDIQRTEAATFHRFIERFFPKTLPDFIRLKVFTSNRAEMWDRSTRAHKRANREQLQMQVA